MLLGQTVYKNYQNLRAMIQKMVCLFFLVTSLNACGQSNLKKVSTGIENNQSTVSVFISNFAAYTMDIQAAGIATIPKATLSESGELYIEYAYHSGGENRNGKMTLYDKGKNRFEGKWKTDADNGNSYQGTLYFVFDELGNGSGNYKFGRSDYQITIQKNI